MPKKIVRPTASEKKLVKKRMLKKYGPKRIYKVKEDWATKLKRKVKAVFSREKAAKKDFQTLRTSDVSERLRKSGMPERYIKKLRGKK